MVLPPAMLPALHACLGQQPHRVFTVPDVAPALGRSGARRSGQMVGKAEAGEGQKKVARLCKRAPAVTISSAVGAIKKGAPYVQSEREKSGPAAAEREKSGPAAAEPKSKSE